MSDNPRGVFVHAADQTLLIVPEEGESQSDLRDFVEVTVGEYFTVTDASDQDLENFAIAAPAGSIGTVEGLAALGREIERRADAQGIDREEAEFLQFLYTLEAEETRSSRESAGAAAANAARRARIEALAEERDATLRSLSRAEEDRLLDYQNQLAGIRAQRAQRDAGLQQQLLATQVEGVQSGQRDTAEALARTLEALGIQNTAAERDFGLNTAATQGALNRLAGVGSRITNLTQDIRRTEEGERQQLVDIQEREAEADARSRQEAYGRQLQDLYVRQTQAQQDADDAFLDYITQSRERQRQLDAGRSIEDVASDFDDRLAALAGAAQGGGSTASDALGDAGDSVPDVLYGGGAAGWGGIF